MQKSKSSFLLYQSDNGRLAKRAALLCQNNEWHALQATLMSKEKNVKISRSNQIYIKALY